MSSQNKNLRNEGFFQKDRVTCRVCNERQLEPLWDLGNLYLTGSFPENGLDTPQAQLHVGQCLSCTTVQLMHDYSTSVFFGPEYGYRSGLNRSMVAHLTEMVAEAEKYTQLSKGDVVIDIGGNDGTALSKYSSGVKKILVDPTANNWKEYIGSDIEIVPDFFKGNSQIPGESAQLVTSASMLYDLECPVEFIQDIWSVLKPGGYWLTEQSDLQMMLEQNSFDTICHEHLEYYSRDVVVSMACRAGFQLHNESVNHANGGTRRFIFRKLETLDARSSRSSSDLTQRTLENQRRAFLKLKSFVSELKESFFSLAGRDQNVIHGLGASTKGNTILQVLGVSAAQIKVIAEVNPRKFGKQTPGTCIPIVSEEESLELGPSHYFVLPWHFKSEFEKNWGNYRGCAAVYPLPSFQNFSGK